MHMSGWFLKDSRMLKLEMKFRMHETILKRRKEAECHIFIHTAIYLLGDIGHMVCQLHFW